MSIIDIRDGGTPLFKDRYVLFGEPCYIFQTGDEFLRININ